MATDKEEPKFKKEVLEILSRDPSDLCKDKPAIKKLVEYYRELRARYVAAQQKPKRGKKKDDDDPLSKTPSEMSK